MLFHKHNSLISEPSYRRLHDPVLLTLITWDVLKPLTQHSFSQCESESCPKVDKKGKLVTNNQSLQKLFLRFTPSGVYSSSSYQPFSSIVPKPHLVELVNLLLRSKTKTKIGVTELPFYLLIEKAGGSHFTFWAFPQQILLHFPNSFLHFPIKIASFTQKNAAFPQQFAAFPQQIASFPQQFVAFPYVILCHFAKKKLPNILNFSHISG